MDESIADFNVLETFHFEQLGHLRQFVLEQPGMLIQIQNFS
jgi:hypothetical protein